MRKHTIIFFFLFAFSSLLQAQKVRPKIGYAFGGGGAKGIAEIGVLKVLEEAGIRPDYITGTSIGSIIGGLYAIGYSVEELEELAKELNWEYYFNDELSRTDLPIEERMVADRYQLQLNIENGKIQLPRGFVQGQKIGLLLSQLTFPVHGQSSFDQFDIPFRCVAADFETGVAVVLKSGSLAKSMRASMSIPSIFEPIEIDGKLLVDGGVASNLPVKEVIDMGADMVIAIDITSPLYKKDELSSLLQVLEQTGTYRLIESVQEAIDTADIVIRPDINEYGALDFSNADSLLARGERAARKKLPEILALINGKAPLPKRFLKQPKSYVVNDIRFKGISPKQQKTVESIVRIRPEKTYSLERIEARIKKLFGSQFFKEAYYEFILDETGNYTLDIKTEPQSGEFVQLSANYDSDLKAALLLNATYRNRGLSGSRLSVDAKISENPFLQANYLVYTAARPNIGLHLGGKLNHYPAYYYDDEGNEEERFLLSHYDLRLDVFSGISNHFMVSLGLGIEQYSQRTKYFDKDTEDLRLGQTVAYLSLLSDTYDRVSYPRSGYHLSLDGKFSFAGKFSQPNIRLKEDLRFFNKLARLQFSKIFPLSDQLAIKWYNDAGWIDFEKDNYLNLFYLGRNVPGELTHAEFIGLDYMELPVTSYVFSGIKFRTELKSGFFTSLLFNYGRFKVREYIKVNEGTTILTNAAADKIVGMGAEFGLTTSLGPVRMTAEYNLEEKRANFSLHLGYIF